MDNNVLLTIFIGCTAAAVIIQAGILVALYLSVRKSSTRIEALTSEVRTKAIPMVESANALLTELRPKIETIAENLSQTTTLVRSHVQRLDATVNDIIDRTLDKVEETTEMVHHTVVSPIRQVSGLVQGLSAGLQYFLGRRRNNRAREAMGVPQDELFI